jgi:hypothetical protein
MAMMRFSPSDKIEILKPNPYRENTQGHENYRLYRNGMTVSEYEEAYNKEPKSKDRTARDFLSYDVTTQGCIRCLPERR